MGVMCSLLGHDYGDAAVERERAEQGDEVVRTAKRVERCRNCDHARTISENTEVTALSAAAGVVRKPDGTVVAATDEPTETVNETDEDERTGGVRTTADGTAAGSERAESARISSGERTESGSSIAIESVVNTESALIPDGDETDVKGANERTANESIAAVGIDRVHNDSETRNGPPRAPGEWPTEPANTTVETTRESSGLGSSGSLADGGPPASHWPGETDTAETQTAPANRRTVTGNGVGNGTDPAADFSGSNRAIGGSFACASCGFSAAVADSPLRAGDICPDCGRGYLAWETRKG